MRRNPALFVCTKWRRVITTGLLAVILVSELTVLQFIPKVAEAAVVTIDTTASTDANSHLMAGAQTVFISDQVGYKFYRDSTNVCVYSKTTNGGNSWGAQVTVDAQNDCAGIAVWYDQWTPQDYGSYIHIATMETAAATDMVFYNRLDTNTDTLLLGTAPIPASASSSQTGTFTSGTNVVAITKSMNNEVLITIADATDAYVVSCTSNCNLGANWAETGSPFLDVTNDWSIMVPLTNGNVLLINRDISADTIRSRVWNGSSWSASWTTVDTAVESGTYDVGMAAVVDHTTGDVYLAYAADNDNFTTADHDIRTAKFSSGSWTGTTALFTNRAGVGLHNVAISLDVNTGNIYVGYTLRTTIGTATTANVYFATSTSAMSSWSPEQGPVNSVAQNLYGMDMNIMSDERIYATWVDTNLDDVLGNTVADIAPITKLTASGTPTSTITASTSNVYTRGQFVIKENVTSRNVTDIVLTEGGTIDGSAAIRNIKLFYDLDTSSPYNCASESYGGSESQFGSTDTNGFSGANGTAAFAGLVGISPTAAMCVYVVLDVTDAAGDGETLSLSVESPNNDILVSGGVDVSPIAPVRFATSTQIRNDRLTQTHYHWRNDNGNETGATSATAGVQDTPIPALQAGNVRRLRVGISNEGSLTSPATNFRLEYAELAGTCSAAASWTDVGATNDAWNMSDSTFITDGNNTTNIATSSGGVGDENSSYLASNGGLRDTSSQTGSLTLTGSNFVDLEFSVVASSSAIEGMTYCFRVTDAGTPLPSYLNYGEVTITADVTVSATGTLATSKLVPATNQYAGGAFVIKENVASRTVTDITITETGTVNATSGLDNIRLYYDLDTSAPYTCASESYSGSESQFGATDTDGFSDSNGSSTFSGSQAISTTSAMCVYVVYDVTEEALNAETVRFQITSAAAQVVVSSGSVSPSSAVSLTGTTTLVGPVMTQTGYHWRTSPGTEASSTSATLGNENTVLADHGRNTPIKLRLGLSNEGAATSATSTYRLEFGPKVSTCENITVWSPVSATDDDWNMYDDANYADGTNSTNISNSIGGVTDANPTFLTPNGGLRDTTSTSSALRFATTTFTELEFSIMSTNVTANLTTYCFRLTAAGVPLPAYTNYAEITTAPKRDFRVQRGTTYVSGTSTLLTAGIDYVAPASSTLSFVRIVNTHHTGAGRLTAGGGAQNADDTTAFISSSTNLISNFRISRPNAAINNTRVDWELVEFIGDVGTDNEIFVRSVGTINFSLTATTGSSSILNNINDDSDVVVFITGISNNDTGRNVFYSTQMTSEWNATTNQAVFRRGSTGASSTLSYAVVEFVGQNWRIQRVEHTYGTTTAAETEMITPVNSLARTFLHTQKRMSNLGNVNNFGHEVWLSSIGAVSFQLDSAATTPSGHVSVAWVIENQQTSAGAMKVQRYNGTTNAGTEPVTIPISLFTPIDSITNTSISATSRVVGANTNFPLVLMGAQITSTTTFEFWRSEASAVLTYRAEVFEWPINGLSVRQNYYRFYADNNTVTPNDPWPPGPTDIGENTPISASDEPLGDGDLVRLRMTYKVANASLPAGLYDFKLQYGLRTTSCSSIENWTDLGASGSGAVWRGYAATGTSNGASVAGNPPSGGELLLSVSDVGGSLIEENPAPANPYLALPGDDVEYDWFIEPNAVIERSVYCFRMVRSDGTTLDGYFNYPQARTAGFSPVTKNWRWYGDELAEPPTAPLSGEDVAPIEVENQDVVTLRVTVGERKGVTGQNVKFKLQYDESSSFTNPRDVVATSSCLATSTWCYAEGAGNDNATITASVLSDTDGCISGVGAGCGRHNTSPTFVTGLSHLGLSDREYSFYLRHAAARAGAVYYFRLYEVLEDLPVVANTAETYPSLVAETAALTLTVSGLPAGTSTAGVTLTASSSPEAISFGSIPINTNVYAAHRLALSTNATQGYRVLMFARQQLLNSYGSPIASVLGTNGSPSSWVAGCSGGADGCVGYHTTDATLSGASPTRFAPLDSYAGLSTTTSEIMYSPIPSDDTHDILYRVQIGPKQPAGDYETEMVYIAIPTY